MKMSQSWRSFSWDGKHSQESLGCFEAPFPDLVPGNEIFDVYSLLEPTAHQNSFYTYPGSLTTPPCTEFVSWHLADTPLKISPSEYNRLSNLLLNFQTNQNAEGECELASIANRAGYTSRPPQPLNGRNVEILCPLEGTGIESQPPPPSSKPKPPSPKPPSPKPAPSKSLLRPSLLLRKRLLPAMENMSW